MFGSEPGKTEERILSRKDTLLKPRDIFSTGLMFVHAEV
jgi:hypothetical protein